MDSAASIVSPSPSCSVCHRAISVTAAGLVRLHGPVHSRCPGSHKPPALQIQSTPSHPPGDSGDNCGLSPSQYHSPSPVLPPRSTVAILKRIPCVCREASAKELASILEVIVRLNNHLSWYRLLRLATRCFHVSSRGGHRWSLSRAVYRQLSAEADPPRTPAPSNGPPCSRSVDTTAVLATRVSSKLGEGDFRGAVRVASSEDQIADMSESTLTALEGKHPIPHPNTSIPPFLGHPLHLSVVSVEEVSRAIMSFPNGLAGGSDGLRPQHLKDRIGHSANSGGHFLLTALAAFVTLVLEGRTPSSVCPFFFGASLIALGKKEGGIRPIAVGYTLRRLVAKVAGSRVMAAMGALLAPIQLEYGIKGGCKAAVHSVKLYLDTLNPNQAPL